MNIDEAEKIAREFGEFYTNRGSLVVLEDGTIADDYEGFLPYFSVWDLPYSLGKIKYAYFIVGEYASSNPELYTTPRPIGDILAEGYKLLADFVEGAYEINQEKLDIEKISDEEEMKSAINQFEAKHKLDFYAPDGSYLWVEYRNFLADLDGNWRTK